MVYDRALTDDIKQLTALRIAYLTEDNGELKDKYFESIKLDLSDYFMRNLNKTIFSYIARNARKRMNNPAEHPA